MSVPKFTNVPQSFHTELKKRITEYFDEVGKSTYGNYKLFIKAVILMVSFVFIYIHLVFFTPNILAAVIECVLLGGIVAAIGFNVMHDGAHGSFSKYKWLNRAAAYSMNFLGASAIMWHMKHNIIHHTYTNIDGVDDDLQVGPWLRMATTQKKRKIHRFQHYYVWFLYTMPYIMVLFVTDYDKYFNKKIGNVPIRKMTVKEHISFWIAKVIYAFMMIAVPIYFLGFNTWLVGFLCTTMITGFVMIIVFQLAHNVEHTDFPMPAESGKIENEWALHQLETTANFATNNKLISWLVGGLNFQIEHHLFPKISHIHYPAISKIIRQTCQEYGINYIEYPKMRHAIVSHVIYLKKLGQMA